MQDQQPNSSSQVDSDSDTQSAGTEQSASQQTDATCPPFNPSQFDRETSIDNAVRYLFYAGLILLCLPSLASALMGARIAEPQWFSTLMLALIVFWIWVSTTSARIARQMGSIAMLTEQNPEAAENLLAQQMTRLPLQRQIRITLYHRLALIRHRQMRFHEAAVICQSLLAQPIVFATRLRISLLLIQLESLLQIADVSGAYLCIVQLKQHPLRLTDRMQLLALQTKYELSIGQCDLATTQVQQRVQLAELLPAYQCSEMHAMLALAAERSGQAELSDWLNKRAVLLAPDEEDEQTGNDIAPQFQ